MFSKRSRYRKLDDVVTADAEGRSAQSKALRLLPEVSGTFLHTVEEPDRLDHLAYKYYKQPQKWWRICDANPEFMLPQALLGKDPVKTTRFPLTVDEETPEPFWVGLLSAVQKTVGVERAQLAKEETALVDRVRSVGLNEVTVKVPEYRYVLIVRHNVMNVDEEALAAQISGLSFTVGPPESVGRVGKQIIIPPNIVG